MLGSDKDIIDNKNRTRLGGWEYAGWVGGWAVAVILSRLVKTALIEKVTWSKDFKEMES